jgi:predicted PurR-regulated permease PerM
MTPGLQEADGAGSSEESRPPPSPPSLARRTLQVLLVALGVGAVVWALYRLRGVLLLLVLAVFFAYLVAPFVSLLRRPLTIQGRKLALPLPAAIALVYGLILGALAALFLVLLPVLDDQLGELATELPGYLARIQGRWQRWQAGYRSRALPAGLRESIDRAVHDAAAAGGTWMTGDVLPRLAGALVYLPWLILVPVLAFFLLKDAGPLRGAALRAFPRGHLRSRGDAFLLELNDTLAAYIRAQVTACLLIGVICTLAFLAIGVPYALVLGIAAGVLEFIPLGGPLAAGALATAFAAFHSSGQVIAVVLFLLGLRALQDYVVYPKIVGMGIHMNPLGVILAILCGAELAGLAGVFLAIPLVAVLTLASEHYRGLRAAEALHSPDR